MLCLSCFVTLGEVVLSHWAESKCVVFDFAQTDNVFEFAWTDNVFDYAQTDISIDRKAILVSNKSRAVTDYSIDNINN